MTSTSMPLVRRRLLATARQDIHAAMAGAIPFVLAHPAEAGVLSELGAIAAASPTAERDLDVFRRVVGELVATAQDQTVGQRSSKR